MSRWRSSLSWVAGVTVALLLLVGVSPVSAATMTTVSGVVSFGTAGNHPGEGVRVSWDKRNPSGWTGNQGYVDASADGTYSLSLEAGYYYTIRFQPLGVPSAYQSQYWNRHTSTNYATLVSVGSTPITDIDVTLALKGLIEGHVTLGASGVSAAANQVRVSYQWCPEEGCHSAAPTYFYTDASGNYSIPNLSMGTYKLTFGFLGGNQYQGPPVKLVEVDYTTQVHSNTDVVMPETASITGHVDLGSAGSAAPAGAVIVRATSIDGYTEYSAPTNANGDYSVAGLPSGTYRLMFDYVGAGGFADQYWTNQSVNGEAVPPYFKTFSYVDVTSGPVGRNAVLIPGGSISGVVRNVQGDAVAGVSIIAKTQDPDHTLIQLAEAISGPDGSYVLSNLPPLSFSLHVAMPSDIPYTRLVDRVGGDSNIVIQPGSAFPGIDFTMHRFTSLDGKVTCACDLSGVWPYILVALERNTGTHASPVWTPGVYTTPSEPYTVPASSLLWDARDLLGGEYRLRVINVTGSSIAVTSTPKVVTVADGQSLTVNLSMSVVTSPARVAAQKFVLAAYADVLGRTPAPGEGDFWVNGLLAGQPRSWVANGFNNSTEYRLNKIEEAYQSVFGREGDPGGVAFWLRAMESGQVSSDDPHRQFLSSNEFYQNNGHNTPSGFVTAIYLDQVGRAPDPGGMHFWLAVLASQGRQAVVDGLWFSNESYRTRISEAYEHLFGRAPDAGGLLFWVDVARVQGITAIRGELMSSNEYWTRAQARF